MNMFRVLCAALCTLAAGTAAAQNGLVAPDDTPWPRWQLRAQWLGAPGLWHDVPSTSGLRIVGDYYLLGLRSASGEFAGGLRATSALTFARGAAPADRAGAGLAWPPRAVLPAPSAETAWGALPYVGVGFTGVWPRVGWGVTADLGWGGHGSGLRWKAAGADGSAYDDVVRELRLAPTLQLGVTYSF
ncbi:hypothetical protein MOJ79_11585 [Calidifontimicrobium sp. SYSU G02091]|uniref:hypothetical protein n=1 Tax=Calidifontimicrobium sp. SYSU G02091 TaxID=2926421 RepID=UPI001F53A385|nr:hypothetical protein [Calidifontimicrobium sp. SYSU G02091]MCI1192485.1 hypothetical protein [Calidifontimicrobium sp. SYSU G02091]